MKTGLSSKVNRRMLSREVSIMAFIRMKLRAGVGNFFLDTPEEDQQQYQVQGNDDQNGAGIEESEDNIVHYGNE